MENRSVFVLGSINTDLAISTNRMPYQGETINGFDFNQMIGGKGCNQAVNSSEFGTKTYLIGCVGRDYFGQFTFNRLLERSVLSDYVQFVETESTGVAIVLRSDNDNRIILNQGANGHVSQRQIDDALDEAKKGDIFLTQFEVPMNLVDDSLRRAKMKGLYTVVNPAPAVYLEQAMYQNIDCLILNQTEAYELTEIFPKTVEEAQSAANKLITFGVQSVILTCGEEGSYYLEKGDNTYKQVSYPVNTVDSTGAGDAFIGVYVAALAQGYEVRKALSFASAAGAVACTSKGAQEKVANKEELIQFLGGK